MLQQLQKSTVTTATTMTTVVKETILLVKQTPVCLLLVISPDSVLISDCKLP